MGLLHLFACNSPIAVIEFLCFCYDLEYAEEFPVRCGEDEEEQVADDGQRQTDLYAVFSRERIGRKGQYALRRIDRQDETEADDELQDHRGGHDIDDRAAESLQDRYHDRNHRGGHGRSTGETDVNDDQEQGEYREDGEQAHARESERA